MLTDYIHAALRRAKYELIEDGDVFGKIAGFPGLWASADTLEECRESLRSSLEDWMLIKLRMGDNNFPVLGKLNLNERRSRKAKVA